jgi:hypothetical protein
LFGTPTYDLALITPRRVEKDTSGFREGHERLQSDREKDTSE